MSIVMHTSIFLLTDFGQVTVLMQIDKSLLIGYRSFKLQMKYLISGVITTIRITQIRRTKIGRRVTMGQTTKNSRISNYVGILRIGSGTN